MSSLFFPFAPRAAAPQPQAYSHSPFGFGFGFDDLQPTTSRSPRRRPRYDDFYGPSPYHQRQEQLRQRQLLEQERLRQRQLLEQEERQRRIRRQKRRAKSLVAERVRLRLIVRSVTKIQRAFREFRARRLNAAARIVTRFIRNMPPLRRARFVLSQLHEIKALQSSVGQAVSEFQESTQLSQGDKERARARLKYEDALVKLTLKADGIPTRGDEIIRSHRKAFVKKAQSLLAKLDEMSESDEDNEDPQGDTTESDPGMELAEEEASPSMESDPSLELAEENASPPDVQNMELDAENSVE